MFGKSSLRCDFSWCCSTGRNEYIFFPFPLCLPLTIQYDTILQIIQFIVHEIVSKTENVYEGENKLHKWNTNYASGSWFQLGNISLLSDVLKIISRCGPAQQFEQFRNKLTNEERHAIVKNLLWFYQNEKLSHGWINVTEKQNMAWQVKILIVYGNVE